MGVLLRLFRSGDGGSDQAHVQQICNCYRLLDHSGRFCGIPLCEFEPSVSNWNQE